MCNCHKKSCKCKKRCNVGCGNQCNNNRECNNYYVRHVYPSCCKMFSM